MKNKSFLITVDTEGDGLWSWRPGQEITTHNANYIPRFQELCEKYGFKPVYLTNYEMAQSDEWVSYAGKKSREGKCEIGLHVHAWNTPPSYELNCRYGGNPYITEYPYEIMKDKTETVYRLLCEKFETQVVSHRSGRWATNKEYFDILADLGINIDCSVTPGLDLSGISGCETNCGNDYSDAPMTPYYIHPDILEVPMTTARTRRCCSGTLKHRVKAMILKQDAWLRPITKSVKDMILLSRIVQNEDCDHLELMIHSSELMPGGSPYFKSSDDVDRMYELLEEYFKYITNQGYIGKTLQEFATQEKERLACR